MNITKLTTGQQNALFNSLRDQYHSGRPMTPSEESTMWELQGTLWQKGFKYTYIKERK